jgi:hypothetical protein
VDHFKKGQKLWVKAPPYYDKEYLYEVISAGDKKVRASLYHSPKVKKSWSIHELHLLVNMGIIRLVEQEQRQ